MYVHTVTELTFLAFLNILLFFQQMNLLLKEYLSSGDCEEAVRCLRELEVPHFHHEIVYEAVILVLEDPREETAKMICNLLRYMAVTTVITQDQLNTVSETIQKLLPLSCSM